MAEAIFRKAAEGTDYEVGSAGVAAQPGSAASVETRAVLNDQRIELGEFRMTEGHLEMLEMLFPEYEEKYHLACDFVEINGKVGIDVPDPIGMGRKAYESVAKVLNQAIGGIMGFLDERAK